MATILPYRPDFPTTRKKSGHSSRLVLHYIADDKVLCEAVYQLAADTRFIELPIPVLHLLTQGLIR